MIRVESLTYYYPRSIKPALQDINMQVVRGEFLGVVGANGAGKSTLCYVLSGFVPHFYKGKLDGRISVAGYDVAETSLGMLTARVGLVFQNPFNQISGARYTVREEVAFGLENLGIPRQEMVNRVDGALARTGLLDLAERSPFEISGGQQQRLAIASVMVMEPEVLVLDEPTSQLDPAGTREVFATLRSLVAEGQTTVVLVTHKLEWLGSFADRVIALVNGGITADGTPQRVLTRLDLQGFGVAATRYTLAAVLAKQRGLIQSSAELPVTLEQAAEYFGGSQG